MIHIKERLMQYADKYSGCYKYAGVYVKVIQDMIEQLLADLEEDEKENGWIPVSERLPDPSKYVLVSFENFAIPMIGIYTVDDDGGTFRVNDEDDSFLEYNLYVNAWMELPECYKEDEHDYILIRTYAWNHSRSGWSRMHSDHVR